MGSSASMFSHSYVAEGLEYTLEFETQAFAEGSCRLAFKGVYRGSGPKNGQMCVTKVFKDEASRLAASNYYPDARCSIVAEGYAKTYNRLFQPARPLHFIQPILARTQKIAYPNPLVAGVLSIGDYISVEDYIPGLYRKFNSNTGWFLDDGDPDQTVPAFCHFTYHHSGGRLLVCDIQGVLGSDGYSLTDPAIHSRRQEFGVTDLGPLGMARFFKRHRCGSDCRDWRLPQLCAPGDGQDGEAAEATVAEAQVLLTPPTLTRRKSRAYAGQLNSAQRTVNAAYRNRADWCLPDVADKDGSGVAA